MTRIAMILAAILLLVGSVIHPVGKSAAQTTPPAAGGIVGADQLTEFATKFGQARPNPHFDLACVQCHRSIPTGTNTEAIHKSFIVKPSALCKGCHPRYANIHPTDRKPSMITPPGLPLDESGNITCTTCHRLHDPNAEFMLLRGFLDGEYQQRRDLCFACHGAEFIKKNPHSAELGSFRCTFCHQVIPSAEDTAGTVTFRMDVIQMCNFCHDVQRRFHPLNVDANIQIPDILPRAADGEITCGTCHNPHGEVETVHLLRKPYVESVQVLPGKAHGINPECEGCHPGRQVKGKAVRLRYGGNITILCNSCHGGSSEIHPVDIQVPPGLKQPDDLPLSEDKRITCLTCHRIECTPADVKRGDKVSLRALLGGDQAALDALLGDDQPLVTGKSLITTRFFDRNKGENALCFKCHNERQFKGFSPHMGIDYKQSDAVNSKHCRFCHDVDPGRGARVEESVSFISNPRMICLRCHPERPHPASFDHLIKPVRIQVPPTLPVDIDGRISCSTCHDPHSSTVGRIKTRVSEQTICTACHKK